VRGSGEQRSRHSAGSRGDRLRALTCLAVALGALGPLAASAQIPPEIPLASRATVGARAIALGGAYVGVAEDYTALTYNPAGLTQVRRTEFAGVFERRSLDSRNVYLGHEESTPLDVTRIQSIGFAYPFPTYRGALVVGFSFDRVAPLDQEYFRSGSDPALGVAAEEERISEDGSLNAFRAGFAIEANPGLSVGVTGVIMTGSSRREREFYYRSDDNLDREDTFSTSDIDYTAVTGSLGALLVLDRHTRFGLSLHLPESFDLTGSGYDDIYRIQADPVDTLDLLGDYTFEDEIGLPFRLSAGLSHVRDLPIGGSKPGSILAALDVTYADWSQIDYAGRLRTPDREFVYRATLDVHAGLEYTFPAPFPLRLRGGYSRQPIPYRLIATDVFFSEASKAKFDPDRHSWSFGIGALLQEAATLDLTYVSGGYERRGASDFGLTANERLDEDRLVVGLAFRL